MRNPTTARWTRLASQLALVCAVFTIAQPLGAQSQSGTMLMLEVVPELRMEAVAPASWVADGEFEELTIPLKVLVRFNSRTSGELAVSIPSIVADGGASMQIQTETGPQELSSVPVVMKLYARSGVYDELLRIQRPAGAGIEVPATLEIRLLSSDGAVNGITVVPLPVDTPGTT